jgi:hypothetical protein
VYPGKFHHVIDRPQWWGFLYHIKKPEIYYSEYFRRNIAWGSEALDLALNFRNRGFSIVEGDISANYCLEFQFEVPLHVGKKKFFEFLRAEIQRLHERVPRHERS